MENTELFKEIDDVIANLNNHLIKKATEGGRIPIGYSCSFVPEVLLSVGKLFPIRLRASEISETPLADTYFQPTICSYCRSLLEYTLNGQFDFIQGFIFNFSCQHMNRLSDHVNHVEKNKFIHVLDATHMSHESAVQWFIDELTILTEKLTEHFKVDINEETLSEAISAHNRFVNMMHEIAELRKLDHPPLSGTEFHKLMIASIAGPKDLLYDSIKSIGEEIKKRQGKDGFRARLMLLGGAIDNPRYIKTIEDMDSIVIGDHFCAGSVPGLHPISEGPESAIERIARHTMKKPCPRMIDSIDDRLNSVLTTIKENKADGVVIEQLKFCDPMNYYGLIMAEYLRENDIPVLKVDREYQFSGEGQLRTRIQAFLERMGK